MDVILYDPKDPIFPPPHKTVVDALRERDYEYTTFDDRLGMEKKHQEEIEAGKDSGYRGWPCAACDWKRADVRKIRERKKKALMRFIRTGKLPPLRSTATKFPKRMTEEEAAKVVLPMPPHLYGRLRMMPEDFVIEDVHRRYLEAMGETCSRSDPKAHDAKWSCGCKTNPHGYGDGVQSCERHRRAMVDGAEE
jgi:hypothetical protein